MFLDVLRFLTGSPLGGSVKVAVPGAWRGCHDPSAFENQVQGLLEGGRLQVHPACRGRGAGQGSGWEEGTRWVGRWGSCRVCGSIPGSTRHLGTHKNGLISFKVRRKVNI